MISVYFTSVNCLIIKVRLISMTKMVEQFPPRQILMPAVGKLTPRTPLHMASFNVKTMGSSPPTQHIWHPAKAFQINKGPPFMAIEDGPLFLLGVGPAFADNSGRGRLHMGVAGRHRCTLYNETLPKWANLTATSYCREVRGWGETKRQAGKHLSWIGTLVCYIFVPAAQKVKKYVPLNRDPLRIWGSGGLSPEKCLT